MSLFDCAHCDVDSVTGVHYRQCPSRLLARAEQRLGQLRLAVDRKIPVSMGSVIDATIQVTEALRAFHTVGIHDGKVDEWQ